MRAIGFIIVALLFVPLFTTREQIVFNPQVEKQLNFHLPFLSPSVQPTKPPKKTIIDTTQLKQSGWYADALKGIEESEYEIKYDKAARSYASPNRKNNLRSFYSPKTFTLIPRSENIDTWKLELSTLGVYAGKKLIYAPDENATVTQNEKRIRFNHHDNFITEYINNKEGVRQNFIIEKEPSSKPQVLNIKLQTNKRWFVNKVHDKEIHFAQETATGYDKKITYNNLKVWDAAGKEIKSFFTTEENSISINVHTIDATYPITIDPLSTGTNGTPDWIGVDADQADANFGVSVASAGDVNGDGYSDVIVGAWLYDDGANSNEGRAFVYYGSPTGLSSTPNWIGDDADQANSFFAETVSGAGDVNGDGYSDVIIGADNYDDGPNSNEGRAFVYHGSALGLSAAPNWIGDDANQPNAYFGVSLNCAGDVNGDGFSDVIIGAIGYTDGGNSNEGRAFVYHGSAGGLSTTPDNTPDDANQANAFFGWSVAGAGDINGDGFSDVIIGALLFDDAGNTDEGRAFVYHGSASGLSTVPDNTPDDADQAGAQFGECVASAGDLNGDGYSDVIIGARLYDDAGNTDEGRAFVYYGNSTGLSATYVSTPDDADQSGASFGISVACAGDINGDGYSDVIIGARFYDDAGNADEGRAFVYYGSSSGISPAPTSTPDDANQSTAYYGYSVASAGDVNGDGYSDVIVGAFVFDDIQSNEGGAFVYHGAPDGLSITPVIYNPPVSQLQCGFGHCVSGIGDVNSDGYSDVIIGSYAYDDGFSDEGRAFVYYGSAAGLAAIPNLILDDGNQSGANFGFACTGAGDVNGDGYDDVIVGAWQYNSEGRAFVYYGSAGGLSATPNRILNDAAQSGAGYGVHVAGAGDVNGDGYSDVMIGAYAYDDGAFADEGRVFIYHGSATGLAATPASLLDDADQSGAAFGRWVASAGDINGDGFGDVMVGATGFDDAANVNEGVAFIYYGSIAGLSATPNRILNDADQANALSGKVSGAGDLNGDGFSDVIVTTIFYNNEKGRAFVYYGSISGLSVSPFILDNTQPGNNNGDRMGYGVDCAGDVNGDGYSDIIIGVPQWDNGGNSEQGRVFIYYGSNTGIAATPNRILADATQTNEFFGVSVSSAGDINGDGFSDVIIGADHGSWPTVGRAFVYYGNDKGGLRNNLLLYNSDLITPMNRSNITDPNLFGAGLFSKSFLGNQKGKLTWQTVRNGNPFSGVPITNSTAYTATQPAFTNLGITGTELKNQVAKRVPAKATYIRARVRYDLVTAITGQVYGPWRYPEGFLRGKREIADVALPVKYLSFTVSKEKEAVLVKWITSNEEPGVLYEIQHSIDGIHFTKIQTTTAQLQLKNEYQYLHLKPSNGNNYYRIKAFLQTKESFTDIRVVNFSGMNDNPLFFPNPIRKNETISIILPANLSGDINVRIINHAGQKVFTQTYTGNSKIEIQIKNWPSGYYIAELRSGVNLISTQKLIVQ
jgi:Secretion system C-terminal sorting domain/FG-GAP repeat/FG-GAP-like repeat